MKFASLASVVLLALVAGCFTSPYTLAPATEARVDAALIGEWEFAPKDNDESKRAVCTIRNFDGQQYYVEWRELVKDKPERYAAYAVDFKGVKFVHMRPLSEDGELDKAWMTARFELTGDTLKIRQLKDEFMKAQGVDSSEKLSTVIAANLENAEMYAIEEEATGTRVKQ